MNEKTCNKCGVCYFAEKDTPCPDCSGIMCIVITPVPGKRVSGVLCRDMTPGGSEICFVPNVSDLNNMKLDPSGVWGGPVFSDESNFWTAEEWKEQYVKLPRKGSKQTVILELVNGR